MRVPERTTKRVALAGAFLLVFSVTTVAFAQAVSGHIAAMQAPSADVTAVDYEVTDDDGLDVTLQIDNPTTKAIAIPTAQVNAYLGDRILSEGTSVRLDGASVDAKSTENVTVPLDFREGGLERFRSADAGQVEIRGQLKSKVVEETVYLSVDRTEVDE